MQLPVLSHKLPIQTNHIAFLWIFCKSKAENECCYKFCPITHNLHGLQNIPVIVMGICLHRDYCSSED